MSNAADGERVDWDRAGPVRGEASLLLSELQHRVNNELASAIAAVNLVRGDKAGRRFDLFEQAAERLEGFGKLQQALSVRPGRTIDLAHDLSRIFRGLVAGRPGLEKASFRLVIAEPVVPFGSGYRIMLIAAELMHNAVRHALAGRKGVLSVRVDRNGDVLILTVSDNGPGIAGPSPTSGTGLGSGIVRELVRGGDGRIECESDESGTVIRVMLPIGGRSPIDWIEPEGGS